jgi:phosphoribosyl 1,2-cyclic phosphodiesterase
MSMELCILASGSSGNSTIVRTGGRGAMLIDIGLGPRSTASRLAGTGAGIEDIRAICLTHLDSDHFNRNWLRTIVNQSIRVFCHETLVEPILAMAGDGLFSQASALRSLLQPFDGHPIAPLDGLRVQPIRLPHDAAGSHGFVLEHAGCRVGYATDLGSVPARLFELFDDLDALALESNYDPQRQMASTRPWMLKQRIMGGNGHLSNQQSLAAVRHILNRAEKKGHALPSHIVLLHRSRDCNCPDLVRRMFTADPRIAARLILAEQDIATGWIRPGRTVTSVVIHENRVLYEPRP